MIHYNKTNLPAFRNNFLKSVALLALLFFSGNLMAQVTTNGGSGLAGSYGTLAAAVTALNGATITSPVIITVNGNETAPAGGYSITAQGTSSNTIIIDGNSKVITASGSLTSGALNDAIFKLVGADYVTLKNFTMQENPSNSTTTPASNNMTEWGVALLYATTTNGAQNNTIQNNTISLNRSYANTFGIYSNVRHSSTSVTVTADITNSTTAPNSNNKVYGNAISNVNVGICFIGSGVAANMDVNNDIGGASAGTANTLTNWGGAAVASGYVSISASGTMGIYANHQTSLNISYNSLTSAASVATATTRGILTDFTVAAPTGTFTNNITNNTITLTTTNAATTFEAIRSFNSFGGTVATVTMNISSNNIINCTLSGGTSSGSITGINNTFACGTLTMNSNIIRNNSTTATTGGFVGIANSGAVANTININFNQIGNSTGGAVTLSNITSGVVTGISNTSGVLATTNTSISSNNFQGFTYGTAGTGAFSAIIQSGAALSENINSNNFNNLTINTSSATIGFFISATNACTNVNINSNFTTTQFTNSTATGAANYIAIASNGGTPASGTASISSNNFSNMSFRTTTSFAAIIYWSTPSGLENITCDGNTFTSITNVGIGTATQAASIYGILASGGKNNVLSNNNLSSFNAAGGTIIGLFPGTASANSAGNATVFNNVLHDFATTSTYGSAAGTAQGIQLQAGPATVNANAIYRNTIYNISANQGEAFGIYVAQGNAASTTNVYNNRIAKLTAPSSVYYQGVSGIFVTNSVANTVNLYYNTVYIDGSCNGQTYAVYTNSATPTINMINNIFENNATPSGTFSAYAYFRTGTMSATYATTSNNNIFYAGTPGALHNIYADGAVSAVTNAQQTLSAFQTYCGGTRESNSRTELSPFITTSGGTSNFLLINGTSASLAESEGQSIAFTTDDFNTNAIRTGYPQGGQVNGGGTAPDIGAYEYDGTKDNSVGVTAFVAPSGSCGLTASTTITITVTNLGGFTVSSGTTIPVNYTINGGSPVNENLVLGSNLAPGASVNYTFTTTANLSSGFFTLVASTAWGLDNISGDNSWTTSVGNLSGTISIPGSYPTLTGSNGLFNAINQAGLSGNLTVNITADVTESGTVALNEWAECPASSNYTLTIQPSGGARTLTGSLGGQGLIRLNGADRVTFNGNIGGVASLTIDNTSGTGGTALQLISTAATSTGGCQNVTVQYCNFHGGSVGSGICVAVGGATIGNTGDGHNNFVFDHNTVANTFNGLYVAGTSANRCNNITITNNTFGSASQNIGNNGMFIVYCTTGSISDNTVAYVSGSGANITRGINLNTVVSFKINHNTIFNINNSSYYTAGIYVTSINTTTDLSLNNTISRNTIHDIKTVTPFSGGYPAEGIYLLKNTTTGTDSIINNVIYNLNGDSWDATATTDDIAGIYVETGTNGGYKIYHNTINLNGTYPGYATNNKISACILIGATSSAIDIRNNMLTDSLIDVGANAATAKSYCIYVNQATNAAISGINYNNYYKGNNAQLFTGFGNSATRLTLANWVSFSGGDANSIQVYPYYNSTSNLTPATPAVNDLGTTALLPTLFRDINNNIRPASGSTNPDMGAYEWTPAQDLGIQQLTNPNLTACPTATEQVTFRIKNFSPFLTYNFSTMPASINYTITGPNPASGSFPIPGATPNLGPLSTVDITVITPYNMSAAGTYTINGTIVATGDLNNTNDALTPAYSYTNTTAQSVIYSENFNSINDLNLPSGWSNTGNVFDRFYARATGGIYGQHGNASTGLAARLSSAGSLTSTATSPKVDFTNCTWLRLKYRVMNQSGYPATVHTLAVGETMDIQVSTDCGNSFTTVSTINSGNQNTGTTFQTTNINLSAFAGGSGIIRFSATGTAASDFWFDLDDISVYKDNVGVTAITAPGSPVCSNGTLTVTATVKNFNTCTPISNVPVQFSVNGGSYVNEIVPGPIPANSSVNYSFTTLPSFVSGSNTLLVQTNLGTDGNVDDNASSTTITYNLAPSASATATNPICTGSQLDLGASPNGMTSYTWSGPGGFSSGIQAPTVTATASGANNGTYSVNVLAPNGCSATANVSVSVLANTMSASSAATSFNCGNNTATITITVSGGTAPYTLSPSTPITGSSISLSGQGAGTHTYTVLDANGCMASTTITTFGSTPAVGTVSADQVVCSGSTFGGSISSASGNLISWQSGTTSSGPWTTVGTNTLSYTSGPLLTGSTYYRVVASTPGCASMVSNTVRALVDETPVSASASSITDVSAVVTVAGANGSAFPTYNLTWTGGGSANNVTLPYTMAGLIPGTSYTVNINYAPNTCGTTAAQVTFSTACTAPVLNATAVNNTHESLSWNTPVAITDSIVYHSVLTASWHAVSPAANPYNLGVIAGTTYAAYVKHWCGTAYVNSPIIYFTSGGAGCTAAIPTISALTPLCSTRMTATWSNTGATSYRLTVIRLTPTTGVSTFSNVTGTSYTFATVPGSVYQVCVQSQCSLSSNSPASLPSTTTAPASLAAPDNVITSAQTCAGFTVSWTPVAGASGYKIKYTVNGGTNTINLGPANSYSFYYPSGVVVTVSVATIQSCLPNTALSISDYSYSTTGTSLVCKDADAVDAQTNGAVNDVKVYPNPNSGQFNVSFVNGADQEVSYSVVNLLGQTVYTEVNQEQAGSVNHTIQLPSSLSAGMYYFSIQTGNQLTTKQLMIVR